MRSLDEEVVKPKIRNRESNQVAISRFEKKQTSRRKSSLDYFE